MPLPESPIKLHGKDSCSTALVYYHNSLDHYFEKVICLDHGWKNRIIPELFKRFAEALQSELAPSFDPENVERVAAILARMNFNPPQTNGPKPKRKSPSA